MTENNNRALHKTTEEAKAAESAAVQELPNGPLHTEFGSTTIADTVVQKLAGIATREVPGVYAMGNAARRALNSLAERIPGSQTNVSGGVTIEKGERQTAIDVNVVVEYGAAIAEVAEEIRRSVIAAVEHGTSLEVLEVNVNVSDVHLPEDDEETTERTDRLA